MHTDNDGVTHPITLEPHTESSDVHYARCDACAARWAGPFKTERMAQRVAELANASADYDLPGRCRRVPGPCCVGGVPVELPGVRQVEGEDPTPVRTPFASGALGAVALLAALGMTVANAVRFVIGLARFAVRHWWLALGAVFAVAVLGKNVEPVGPSPVVVAQALIGILAVLVVGGVLVLVGRSVLRDLRAPVETTVEHPAPEQKYSTPLTTAGGASNVVDVSRTPADELPKG